MKIILMLIDLQITLHNVVELKIHTEGDLLYFEGQSESIYVDERKNRT